MDQLIEGTAYFATYLVIIVSCIGLWVAYRHRRYALAAALILGSAVALVLGVVASSNRWVNGVAVIDLDVASFSRSFVIHLLALITAAAIAFIAYRMYQRALIRRTVIAHSLLLTTVVIAGFTLQQASPDTGYTLQGDAAIPIMTSAPEGDQNVELPEGFQIRTLIDSGIGPPTSLCISPDRVLFVSDVSGQIWMLDLAAADGVQEPVLVTDGLNTPLGLDWLEGELYVSSAGRVDALRVEADGSVSGSRTVIEGLPAQIYVFHQNNQLKIGPDGRVYVGIGATSDVDPETTPLAASIVSFNTDGSDLQVVATGLRNPYGLTFDEDGQLWATDNGPVPEFETSPPEELNAIYAGKDYGFPESYTASDPAEAGELPVAIFPPHSSVDGLDAYPRDLASGFPPEYGGDLFLAGWANGRIYRVQVHNSDGAYLQHTSVFASGFSNPLDIIFDDDGSMYVADYGSFAVYVVEYE